MTKVKLIKQILKKGGTRLLYSALLLFYAFKRKDLPAWAKSIVIGALGYLLSPILDCCPMHWYLSLHISMMMSEKKPVTD